MANPYFTAAPLTVYDGDIAKASDLNNLSVAVETAFDLGDQILQTIVSDTATILEDASADVVLTHADVLLTNADVVLTHADVVLTHADVVLTNADAAASEISRLASGVSAGESEAAKVISVAQADTATAQAVIATNKAAEAAASAASITPVAEQIHAAAAKSTPDDADEFAVADSAATFGLKKLTWANLKATLLATWKDATGGLVGMTLFKINFKNTANTFTSFLTNTNTAVRTYTFPDRDGMISVGDVTNDIGTPGLQGFGVGICPTPPPGFAELSGTRDKASDNYGNYLYQDGSVMAWVPLFYYRIAHASNPTYATYLLNSIDIKPESYFADVAAANAAGYALHRAFRDGGVTKRGVWVDKYGCSNNAGVASSIRYGKPLSAAADHNPISALNGAPALTHAGVIDAVKTRGARFFPALMFHRGVLALISNAHGQAASGTTYCAWYDATYNFPKGNNNNALGDTNDAGVLYLSDGYSNCGKCGSGTPFAKTTHNGQACGIADLNGNMWEITLGLTRPGTTATEAINDALGTAKFHILKESVAAASLTSGWNSGNDHWGTDAFLDTNFQEINLPHVGAADGWQYFGNGTNQVFSADLSGNNWLMTGLGIYKDANGASASGTNLFGQDGLREHHMSNLCVLSGGYWADGGQAGLCCASLLYYRSYSVYSVGFRAACYCD
jgi:hypothetical protein